MKDLSSEEASLKHRHVRLCGVHDVGVGCPCKAPAPCLPSGAFVEWVAPPPLGSVAARRTTESSLRQELLSARLDHGRTGGASRRRAHDS